MLRACPWFTRACARYDRLLLQQCDEGARASCERRSAHAFSLTLRAAPERAARAVVEHAVEHSRCTGHRQRLVEASQASDAVGVRRALRVACRIEEHALLREQRGVALRLVHREARCFERRGAFIEAPCAPRRAGVLARLRCAGVEVGLRRTFRVDIVKDVRGSESNCEQDSRKM